MKCVIFAAILAFAAHCQAQWPGTSTTGTSMSLPLPANQAQQMWQKYFMYRLIYGEVAARLIMADAMANMMGGSAFSRFYAGQFFDTPDLWWLMSTMTRNQAQNPASNTQLGQAGMAGALLG